MRCAVIGAGATGRGLLGRLVKASGNDLVFIDVDKELVAQLNAVGEYRVRFYGRNNCEQTISGYSAISADAPEAISALVKADCILTAVGSDRLAQVFALLERAKSDESAIRQPVLFCENGVNPGDLRLASLSAVYQTCLCVVICTCQLAQGLDVYSEDVAEVLCDASALDDSTPLPYGFARIRDFNTFSQRKLYTYNAISACICYIGALKGYTLYGDAARDTDIAALTEKLATTVSKALHMEYGVPLDEQMAFARRAIDKFSNPEIIDTIVRNAREALRKLGAGERICGPLKLVRKHGMNAYALYIVAGAALCYGVMAEGLLESNAISPSFLKSYTGINDDRDIELILQNYKRFKREGCLGCPSATASHSDRCAPPSP